MWRERETQTCASFDLVRLASQPSLPFSFQNTIAFFHPAAAGGGGGERVLWAAVQAVQAAWPRAEVWIYVGAEEEKGACPPSGASLAAAADAAFGLPPPRPVEPVPLPGAAAALDPASHPRLTLVTQSLAGARVAWSGLRSSPPPAVWVDTAGWAGGYPLAALAGSAVLAYVHYPLVSTDMLARLRPAAAAAVVASGSTSSSSSPSTSAPPSALLRAVLKAAYYYAVAALYGAVAGLGAGRGAGAVMANSTWTARHVSALWWRARPPALVHPPCGAAGLAALPLERPVETHARPLLVCVAQFRPETAQALLLRALAAARAAAAAALEDATTPAPARAAAASTLSARLLFFGSVRPGGPDEERVVGLRGLAGELGLLGEEGGAEAAKPRRRKGAAVAADGRAGGRDAADDPDAAAAADPASTPASLVAAWTRPAAPPVGFIVGAPRPVLAAALGAASAGLHAMTDEHFGISVVEYMAAGAVPIAHDSGGPASDIVLPEPQPASISHEGRPPVGGGRRKAAGARSPPSSSTPLPTGFLCTTEAQYAAAMAAVLGMSAGERDAMAARARARAARFSDAAFADAFVSALAPSAAAAGLGEPVVGKGRKRRS